MNALQYTNELVRFPTVSNVSNADICDYLKGVLIGLGFTTERVEYRDSAGVIKVNVIGKKGNGSGGMAYFAHTDAVPADPWLSSEHGPFEPTVSGGKLYARGSCDMKGSIGSMLAATEQAAGSELREPLYIALTADEEIGYCGAEQVARRSKFFREMVQGDSNGIVGEPTMLNVVHAHKGTYGFRATAHGRAAHSSTNEGINANLAMIPFLSEMKTIHDETLEDPDWQHPAFDPPGISWNIGINDHTKVLNMTAAQSICTVYFRPAPGHDAEALIERSRKAAAQCGVDFEVLWAGKPLYVCFWQLHLAHFGGLFWPPCKRASKSLIPGHLLSFLGTWSGAEPEGRSAGRCPQKRAPSLLPPSLLLRQRPTKAVGLLARLDDVSAVGNAIQQRLT